MTLKLTDVVLQVLTMLLQAARQTANTVCVHIKELLIDLRELNLQTRSNEVDDNLVDNRVTSLKGILSNR